MTRGPGVRFPPPLLFVGGFGIGILLNRQLEFLIDGGGAGVAQSAIGLSLIVAGFVLMFWGLATFARARTAILPHRPASRLVRGGPYRFTRNPMYVGLTTAYVGFAVVTNLAWPLVMLPLVLVSLRRFVVAREQRYLLAEFGDAYALYCREIRRWI